MKGYRLPEDLLLGAASSAAQTEGGDVRHNWNKWSRTNRIADGTDIRRGNDGWKNWKASSHKRIMQNKKHAELFQIIPHVFYCTLFQTADLRLRYSNFISYFGLCFTFKKS